MVTQGVLPTQAAAAELFKACEMEGSGLIALGALKWLWALNPSFPSKEEPPIVKLREKNGKCFLFHFFYSRNFFQSLNAVMSFMQLLYQCQ